MLKLGNFQERFLPELLDEFASSQRAETNEFTKSTCIQEGRSRSYTYFKTLGTILDQTLPFPSVSETTCFYYQD